MATRARPTLPTADLPLSLTVPEGPPTVPVTPGSHPGDHATDAAHRLIVTIDGPAGTGKSSVARALARRLGLEFLDTGAMYRAAAALAIDAGLAAAEPRAVCDLIARADLHFDWTTDPPDILASGRSLTARIRDPDVTALVSPLAGIAALREHMVRKQRLIGAQHPRLVAEGRDQGSVVFPDADVKFYLDADPRVRAARRADQLRAAPSAATPEPDEEALLREIVARDHSDRSRAVGPLVKPPDALVVDTSHLTFDQVVDRLESLVRQRAAHRLPNGPRAS